MEPKGLCTLVGREGRRSQTCRLSNDNRPAQHSARGARLLSWIAGNQPAYYCDGIRVCRPGYVVLYVQMGFRGGSVSDCFELRFNVYRERNG